MALTQTQWENSVFATYRYKYGKAGIHFVSDNYTAWAYIRIGSVQGVIGHYDKLGDVGYIYAKPKKQDLFRCNS